MAHNAMGIRGSPVVGIRAMRPIWTASEWAQEARIGAVGRVGRR